MTVNIFDITYIISYLYLEGPPPDVLASANVNGDATVNIFDITYLIAFLYMEGPAPICTSVEKLYAAEAATNIVEGQECASVKCIPKESNQGN